MNCCKCQKPFDKKRLIAQKTIFNRYEYFCKSCYDALTIKEDKP